MKLNRRINMRKDCHCPPHCCSISCSHEGEFSQRWQHTWLRLRFTEKAVSGFVYNTWQETCDCHWFSCTKEIVPGGSFSLSGWRQCPESLFTEKSCLKILMTLELEATLKLWMNCKQICNTSCKSVGHYRNLSVTCFSWTGFFLRQRSQKMPNHTNTKGYQTVATRGEILENTQP